MWYVTTVLNTLEVDDIFIQKEKTYFEKWYRRVPISRSFFVVENESQDQATFWKKTLLATRNGISV